MSPERLARSCRRLLTTRFKIMAQNTFALMTNLGRAKEAAAIANGTALVITHIAIGDGTTVPSGGETSLYHEVARKAISGHGTVVGASNVAYFDIFLEASEGPYTIREAGLIDQDGDLIAIARYDPPISKPIPSSGQTVEGTIRLEVAFSNIANVTIVVDPSFKVDLQRLSRLPWIPVISMSETAPPVSPVAGDAYLIPNGATGAWSGQAGKIAEYTAAGWGVISPPNGHGVSLPDGRIFERVGGTYVEKIAMDAQSGKWNYGEAAGSANALTVNLAPALSAYAVGTIVFVKITTANTGAATLKIGSLAALPIVHDDGSALNAGDLLAGSIAALVCDGTRFIFANAQRGRLIGVQKFAGIGAWTYTPTPGTQSVVVEVQGGGGAGGGARETGAGFVSVGSGGASGGYARSRITSGFAGVTVTVGAGGNPVNGGNGGNGGASSFGSFLSASGGGGGATAGPTGAPWLTGGGWPGNGTGGNIENSPGAPGGVSLSLTTGAANFGAPGGSSRFSGGGSPRSGGGAGVDASGFGGGGGGTASGQNWAALSGGAGAAGIVIIWEYA